MNLRYFQYPQLALNFAKESLLYKSYEVPTKTWHGKPIAQPMWETLNISFQFPISPNTGILAVDLNPNLPWAENHFKERVSGLPFNPPPSHKLWPYAKQENTEHIKDKKFDHSYPERFWPKKAIGDNIRHFTDYNHRGIRFEYGDYDDVIKLLIEDPYTRQAYLPIFHPEDTGNIFKGRIPCSIGYHFIMRGKWLHIVYQLRSCDFIRHLKDDLYMAARLCQETLLRLKSKAYSDWAEIQPGILTTHITSLHCFKHELKILEKNAKQDI